LRAIVLFLELDLDVDAGGRSSFMSESTVCGVGSTMSRRRLWVRISNCSREVLSTCGERSTVHRLMIVGSSTGRTRGRPCGAPSRRSP
jgi:hypothetical protein